MRSVSVRLADLERKPTIPIGFVGENIFTTVRIDCKKIFDEHPNAVPALAVTPPEGDSYPAVVVRDGDIIAWTVSDSDLVKDGTGEFQLSFVVDGEMIGKSYKARTKILDSIVPSGNAPSAITNWLTQAAAALQELPQDVINAVHELMSAMVCIGQTLNPGDDVTVSYDSTNNTLTIGVPRGADGQDGQDGQNGQDGHSPVVTASKTGKVTTIYVDGTAIATVNDGNDGTNGTNGVDGVSPTATVSKNGKVSTFTVTDKNGTTSVQINDGEDGTDIIDDNAGSGDTGKTWSADKLTGEFSDVLNAIDSVEESIAPVESSATATTAHAVGELFILNDQLLVALSAIAVGDTITTTGLSPNAAVTTLSAKMLKDVQVNGTSVVSNGVANIPIAGSKTLGAVKIKDNYGIVISNDGWLAVDGAGADLVKAGVNGNKPLIPYFQHAAAFYGLAKAAGDSTQASSNNAVGTYTAEAKTAIKNMLGISSDIMVVNITMSEVAGEDTVEYTADKTYAEIKAAIDEGTTVVVKHDMTEGEIYYFNLVSDADSDGILSFTSVYENEMFIIYIYDDDSVGFSIKLVGSVQDVQVNGTSVVSQGVANVPVASSSAQGVVKINYVYGVGLIDQDAGVIGITPATSNEIKTGSESRKPIAPARQNESVFFGLSKLAGEDLKNDTVTVGTYPEKSLSAISQMLNAPVSVSGSTPSITAKAGVRYICGEVSTLTIVVPSSGIIDVTFDSGSTPTVLTVTPPTGMTMRWIGDDPTSLEANKHYEINIMDGCNGMVISWT